MIQLKKENVTPQALEKATTRLSWCLFAYFATIPLSLVPIAQLGSVQKYIGIVVALAGALVVLPVLPKIRIAPITWVWFGFTAFLFLGCLWHAEPSKGFSVAFAMALVFAVSALCAALPYDAKRMRIIENAAFVFAGIMILLFIIFGEQVGEQRMSLVFADATANSNQLSCCMLFPAVMLLWFTYSDRPVWLRVLGFALTAVLCALVLLTGSRAGLLSLAIGIFFVLLFHAFGSKKSFLISFAMGAVLLAVIIVVYLFFLPDSVSNRLTIQSAVASGGSNRVEIWESALDAFAQASPVRKIFGWGANGVNFSKMAMHNQFLQLLVDTGIFGLLVYVAMLVMVAVTFAKKNRAMLCVFLALQAYSLFGSCYANNKTFWLVWLFAAVAAVSPPAVENGMFPKLKRKKTADTTEAQ
ncbi:MAG: O-antigen ligase family protein [Clostridia bacterium]|nr:O-antigen ligase family protein [Clostridia bacterium]